MIEAVSGSTKELAEMRKLGEELESLEKKNYSEDLVKLFYQVCGPLRGTTKTTGRKLHEVLGEENNSTWDYQEIVIHKKIMKKRHYKQDLTAIETIRVLMEMPELISKMVTRSKQRRKALLKFSKLLSKNKSVFFEVGSRCREKIFEIEFKTEIVNSQYRYFEVCDWDVTSVKIEGDIIRFIGTSTSSEGETREKDYRWDLSSMRMEEWMNLQPHVYLVKQIAESYKSWVTTSNLKLKKIVEEATVEFEHFIVANSL